MILFKVLKQDGTPRYQKAKTAYWPMPKDGEPGDWVDIGDDRPLGLCAWGLHGWRTLEQAQADCGEDQLVYEMEVDENSPFIDRPNNYSEGRKKVCCQRARITRVLADKHGPLIFMGDYIWQ